MSCIIYMLILDICYSLAMPEVGISITCKDTATVLCPMNNYDEIYLLL